MTSPSPFPHNRSQVTLTDSKAGLTPLFSSIWALAVVFGVIALIAGSFVLSFILLALTLATGFWLVPRALAFLRWHPAEIIISADSFALGATETILYRRRPRKISDIAATQVQLTLECVETARYRVGTNTRTETLTVVQQVFTGTGHSTQSGFEAPIQIRVPSEAGGPTLKLSNNKVEWRMKFQTDPESKLPTHNVTFPLVVGPVLAKPDIQDAPLQPGNQTPQDGIPPQGGVR